MGFPPPPPPPPAQGAPPPPGGGSRVRTAVIAVSTMALVAAIIAGIALAVKNGGQGDAGSAPTTTLPGLDPSALPTVPGASGRGSTGSTGSTASLVPYVTLDPGVCFDHPNLDSGVKKITKRSCDTPHDGQVIANDTLTGVFTTDAELRSKVLKLCEADAKDYFTTHSKKGIDYYYYAIYPSLLTYQLSGKATISCALTLSEKRDGEKLVKPLA